MTGYVIPDDWDGASYVCTQVQWPDSPEWLALLRGALSGFIFDWVWDASTGDVDAAVATADEIVALNTVGDEFPPKGGCRLIGEIVEYAGTDTPSGYLVAAGQPVSRTTYSDLFDVIGTVFGAGDGSTTFNVPNRVERVGIGASLQFGMGSQGGDFEHTLTVSEMPSHNHKEVHRSTVDEAPGYGLTLSAQFGDRVQVTGADGFFTELKGAGAPHNNMQPYTVDRYLIYAGPQAA